MNTLVKKIFSTFGIGKTIIPPSEHRKTLLHDETAINLFRMFYNEGWTQATMKGTFRMMSFNEFLKTLRNE